MPTFYFNKATRCNFWVLVLVIVVQAPILVGQQLCTGNLGENIFVDGDFGTGTTTIILDDPNIAPGYIYHGAPFSPPDGSYLVTNDIAAWTSVFPTWLQIQDNSPDQDGYMMVINASHEPGLFYEKEISGLCDNTLYEFSADVINLIKREVQDFIKPKLVFLINGVEEFTTGDIQQDEKWIKYGFTFTTQPGETTVKLSIRNEAPGGNGNDLALDNISFQACGINGFIDTENRIILCQEEAVTLTADVEPNHVIQWQVSIDSIAWNDVDGATNRELSHNGLAGGAFYYRFFSAGSPSAILNEKCRITSDVIHVEVIPSDILVYDTICSGETYEFGSWVLMESGRYLDEFVSSFGCDSVVTLELTVRPPSPPEVSFELNHPSCYGLSDGSLGMDISGTLDPYIFCLGADQYQLPFIDNLPAGYHNIEIKDRLGCRTTHVAELFDPDEFIIDLGSDTTLTLGSELEVRVTGNHSIEELKWTTELVPCEDCSEFSFIPLLSGPISVVAIDSVGCSATDEKYVTVDNSQLPIYFPNAIHPSTPGDDRFIIQSQAGLIKSFQVFNIYDRWGGLLYSAPAGTVDPQWSGKNVNPGAYIYYIEVELLDNQVYQFTGEITVIK